MSNKKRGFDTASISTTKRERLKISGYTEDNTQTVSLLRSEEVDFPRGGGTNFTPVEYKAIRAEALKELNNEDIFKDTDVQHKSTKSKKRKRSELVSLEKGGSAKPKSKLSSTRVEHLNYKRLVPGMKLLCQVLAVYPYLLIVSLPDQLLGHVPITQVSTQLTAALKAADTDNLLEGDSDVVEEGTSEDKSLPDLAELFQPGQYVRAVVASVKPPGTTEGHPYSHYKDEMDKVSRRVELSLVPDQVNAGLVKADLQRGFALCSAVKSVEDHGYVLDIGLPGVSGFLRYDSEQNTGRERRRVGSLVNTVVDKLAEDGRTCIFTDDEREFKTAVLKEISNVSSLLPGMLVQTRVTAAVPSGLVIQLLGSFEGTINLYHLPTSTSPSDFKVGKKIKARILFDVAGTSPPQFALSLSEHVISLDTKKRSGDQHPIQESYPVGTIVESVKVKRVEPERGLVVAVGEGIEGFVHISHASDEHVPALSSSSGPWKIDTIHRARVIGIYLLDGILQLSLRLSVLSQAFLRVEDVSVGEIVKGAVKKLTDSSLFIAINGNVDAMIWPNHYADIMLKHPQKRFKPGASLRCRVLAVDPDRKRILLTAKKTLVDSDLPILSNIEQAEVGMLAHGVVWKVGEKSLVVEFYNHVRAVIPWREISETPVSNLAESHPVGKPVKVCILSVDRDAARIIASIRQASGEDRLPSGDIKNVEVGQTVSGTVQEVGDDNAVLLLSPSRARASISLHNIANSRRKPVEQLRSSLRSGEKMEELVVVARNLEKGFVIVANRPSCNPQFSRQAALDTNTLSVGSTVTGRVVRHGKGCAVVKFPRRWTGSLHPVDMHDDFGRGGLLPSIDSSVTAAVIAIDRDSKRLTLSTRPSRLDSSANPNVVDPEISDVKHLKIGQKLRGYIKSITDHGIFVTIGHGLDARVQIKELYDQYVKDWKSGLQVNQVIAGQIIGIDQDKRQVEMTLRSRSTVNGMPEISLGDLSVGRKVDGRVKKIEDYGLFISIEGSKLSGLCHKSEIADSKEADVTIALRNFREGDPVKAIILAIDVEKRRISLGLKPSYFSKEDLELAVHDADADVYDHGDAQGTQITSDMEDENNRESDSGDDNAMIIDSAGLDPQSESPPESPKRSVPPLVPVLSSWGFQWTKEDGTLDETDASPSEGESDRPPDKKRKKKKKAIEEDLTEDMQSRTPESVADFERHLLASPNSSFLWIQYMSFQLQMAEIDKARAIGRKALRVISIREEQEKLNVWIALLNLENIYGTEESLESLFKEAARYNDSKTIHLRMASIFDQSGKPEKAEEQYQRTCKKFSKSSKVWTLFGEHYLRRGLLEEARKLLPRSLLSLEKRKHLKTISKFAQLEYKFGDPERGRTVFEGIIDSHPKRWDLWSIYMDMEAGQKDIQSTRSLFGRVFSHKMTTHKAKSFFKKWLEMEHRIGDEAGQQIVKERATEWTRQTASLSS